MFGLGPMEMLIVGVIAVLLFGNRLPEVGRSLGKGLIEFKKGLQGIEEDIDTSANQPQQTTRVERPALQTEFKFDPYTGKPIEPAKPAMRFDPYTGKPLNDATQETASQSSSSNT